MDYKDMLKNAKKNLPVPAEGERFEVPKPIVERSKKQTVIKNFGDIAKSLRREKKHLAKFLFKELAAAGAISGNELVLQGKLHPSMIQQRITDYVKLFVICEECKRPDTGMTSEGKITTLKCEACGAKRTFRE